MVSEASVGKGRIRQGTEKERRMTEE